MIKRQTNETLRSDIWRAVAELQRIQGQDRDLMAKMEQSILYQAFRGQL